MSTVKQNMEFIFELYLADFEDDETTHKSRVGILIGVDYYFNFFGSKILKHLASGRFSGCVHPRGHSFF